MAGHFNFDQELRARWDRQTYIDNKRKGGMTGSSKGQPRPYAKANALKARLWSPRTVGRTLTVVPKHNIPGFRIGQPYEWEVVEPGLGYINGIMLKADEISSHFIVKPKGKR